MDNGEFSVFVWIENLFGSQVSLHNIVERSSHGLNNLRILECIYICMYVFIGEEKRKKEEQKEAIILGFLGI